MASLTCRVFGGALMGAALVWRASALHRNRADWRIPDYTQLDEDAATRRLQATLPMKWLHVPRSGSSFLNIVTHHPKICPDFPQEVVLVRKEDSRGNNIPDGVKHLMEDDPSIRVEAIRGDFWNITSYRTFCHRNLLPEGHNAIGGEWDDFKQYAGKVVTMMRKPEKRLLSAYDYGKMGCTTCGNATEFAPLVAGCVTKMIARSQAEAGAPCLIKSPPPTRFETRLAQERLANDFSFVGLVEEWTLSICLFHAMFGGDCKKVELTDVHPGVGVGNNDLSRLEGYTDPYDGPLYETAKGVFWSKVAEYGLTYAGCRDMCNVTF